MKNENDTSRNRPNKPVYPGAIHGSRIYPCGNGASLLCTLTCSSRCASPLKSSSLAVSLPACVGFFLSKSVFQQ